MFYRPEDGHSLPHNPFAAIVAPRPIGWISTRGADGQENLAPYSFFNAIAYTPPQVCFASTGTKPDRDGAKDSLAQIRETGVFCANVVSRDMAEAMNLTSGPYAAGTDEFDLAGIAREPCRQIPCSRVRDAPAALECRVTDILALKGDTNTLILGEVVGIHIADTHLREGRLDVSSFVPVARLGYLDYAEITETFQMERPKG